jgi:hypothetical protein
MALQTRVSQWARRGPALVAAGLLTMGVAACTPGVPTTQPAPSSTSTAPSPLPTPQPDKADDLDRAKQALITAAELGKPWVAVKAVNSVGTKGEACPGRPNTDASIAPLASTSAQFTAGKEAGAAIGVFSVWTYPDQAAVDAYRKALPKVLHDCRSYTDRSKLSVVLTPADSTALAGTEETWRYTERIYHDKQHAKLAYARQYVIARHGRVLSSVQYAFLTSKSDPKAKDFSTTDGMALQQLSKVITGFA